LSAVFVSLSIGVVGLAEGGGAATTSRDIRRHAAVRIVGGGSPTHVAGGGDVNGDGIPDILVSKGYRPDAETTTYVIFGQRPMPTVIDLDTFSFPGFVINDSYDYQGAFNVRMAGDVNGDGLDDVIVGAGASNKNGSMSGTAYVVFGKKTSEPVELARFDEGSQGNLGYRIDGPGNFSYLGGDGVAGIGDMDGDGLDDLLLAASFIGRSYVVFGKADTLPQDLRDLEEVEHEPEPQPTIPLPMPSPSQEPRAEVRGFRIETASVDSSSDYSVAGAGDINRDGRPDVLISFPLRKRAPEGHRKARALVVFGKAGGAPVSHRRFRGKGFKIKGRGIYDAASSAGDVNGDGYSDILLGAPSESPCCGRAYLVFGKRGTGAVELWNLKRKGFRIDGSERLEAVGSALAPLGDVDSDGKSDFLVAAPGAGNRNGRYSRGAVYVIYGRKSARNLRTDSLGRRGIKMAAGDPPAGIGFRISGAHDLDGDGISDWITGSGGDEAYVVLGGR
jgi:hypothetical protein